MGVPYGKQFTYKNFLMGDTLELDVEVRVDSYCSGYDPYPTSNHDDPRFSDPGEGPEADFRIFLVKRDAKGKEIKSVDITDFLPKDDLESIEERISDEAVSRMEGDYEAEMENRADERRLEEGK